MNNNEYVKAYQKTQESLNTVSSSHEIIRSLMKELVNSMQKIVLDIQDNKNLIGSITKDIHKKTMNKSKSISKSLSIIYGLQTCLDFDKATDIATNLFQLYEYCRHEIIKGFSQKNEEGIIRAIDIVKQIMEGWEVIPSSLKQT